MPELKTFTSASTFSSCVHLCIVCLTLWFQLNTVYEGFCSKCRLPLFDVAGVNCCHLYLHKRYVFFQVSPCMVLNLEQSARRARFSWTTSRWCCLQDKLREKILALALIQTDWSGCMRGLLRTLSVRTTPCLLNSLYPGCCLSTKQVSLLTWSKRNASSPRD